MRIKMLKSHSGSYDGIHVHLYEKGNEYEVDDDVLMPFSLAEVFVEHGMAERVDEKKKSPPGPTEIKDESKQSKKYP